MDKFHYCGPVGIFEGYGEQDEYNDPDATACANGDYNTWEEEQVFQDREWEDSRDDEDYYEDAD